MEKPWAIVSGGRFSPLTDLEKCGYVIACDKGYVYLAELQTALPDEELQRRASEAGLRLAMLSDYYWQRSIARRHTLVVNYSGLDLQHLPQALRTLADILEEESPCTTN